MDQIMHFFSNIWAIGFVRFIVFILLAFICAAIAKTLVTKLLKLVKLDKLFDKWGINEGQLGTSMSLIGKLVYIIVFTLFLPSALSALGLHEVSDPISAVVSEIVRYLPNIVAAGILLYVGIFLAVLISQIVSILIRKTKLDEYTSRKDTENKTVLISDVIAKIVMSVIILITISQALIVLGIEAVSLPALGVINSIFDAVPSIVLAAVVASCGFLVANIVCEFLKSVLIGINFDALAKKVIPQSKVSATKVVINVVKSLIIIFITAQAIEALGLSIFTAVVAAIVGYVPMIAKSTVILLVAFVGASLLEGAIVKSNASFAAVAKIAKIAVYVLAGFMILSQLDIAPEIVNTAFIVTLAAVAVAFALAFGLGGKDFAKKTLEKVNEKCNSTDIEKK